ncbi:MAG: hydrogenase [Candidatus Iainarchaeum archaeon]|uniref:Hydrogenase n=1 Tax=Candidatus Iainarchaeum sp. TaxID=3101447 RepID=A0A497JG30_9ARCH|nr:MAG: hydrogenase [Candidatus Diapherotrites archaeon]
MNAEEFIEKLKKELGKDVSNFKVVTTEHGLSKSKAYRVWADADSKNFKNVVKKLFSLQEYPHFSVSSGFDAGKTIEILLHFALNYANPKALVLFTLRVKLPKQRPKMKTITDLIPGAMISEKEKREFFGIKIEGLAPGKMFLDDSLSGVYPWRRDSKGADKIAKNLHSGDAIE